MFTNKEILCIWLCGLCVGLWILWALLSFTLNMHALMIAYGTVSFMDTLLIFPFWLSEREKRRIRRGLYGKE
jgi:hypothetical protein